MVHYAQGLYFLSFVKTKAIANPLLGSTMPLVPGAWVIVRTSVYISCMRINAGKVLTVIIRRGASSLSLCQCVVSFVHGFEGNMN